MQLVAVPLIAKLNNLAFIITFTVIVIAVIITVLNMKLFLLLLIITEMLYPSAVSFFCRC